MYVYNPYRAQTATVISSSLCCKRFQYQFPYWLTTTGVELNEVMFKRGERHASRDGGCWKTDVVEVSDEDPTYTGLPKRRREGSLNWFRERNNQIRLWSW